MWKKDQDEHESESDEHESESDGHESESDPVEEFLNILRNSRNYQLKKNGIDFDDRNIDENVREAAIILLKIIQDGNNDVNELDEFYVKLNLQGLLENRDFGSNANRDKIRLLKLLQGGTDDQQEIDCEINIMSKSSAEFQFMHQLVGRSIGRGHKHRYQLQHLFRIRNDSSEDFPVSTDDNSHRILMHGTRTENCLSILRSGLKIDPLNTRFNGRMLGNGLYLTNVFSKAAFFCYKRKGPGFVFVCEVSLGDLQILDPSGPIPNPRDLENHDSVFLSGRYHPDPAVIGRIPVKEDGEV